VNSNVRPHIGDHAISSAAELQQLLDGQPKPDCAALTPFVVEEADLAAGTLTLRFAPQPAFKNHFGNVQGGFAVAMIDVLISVAAYAKTLSWLPTVEIKSSFVAPMALGDCKGTASVIKAGKQLVFLEARLWGADSRLAVHATATVAVPSR
jgi:uncharacterized protein (TIGR00369 family)